MAVVLKSNSKLADNVKPLGDKYGITSIVDWKYMLDFQNQEYIEKQGNVKVSKSFSDFVNFTRNTTAEQINQDDIATIVANNIPRFSKVANKMGLLIESGRFNYFKNSDAPISQTVSGFTTSPNMRLVCFVEGSGTVTISGAGLVESQNLIASKDKPAVFSVNNTSGTVSVTATVSGNVTFCQVSQNRGGAKVTSRIHTQANTSSTNSDDASITAAITSNLTKDFTVVMQVIQQNHLLYDGISHYSAYTEIANATTTNLATGNQKLAGTVTSTDSVRLRSYVNGVEGLVSIVPQISAKETTLAITVSDVASWARNGVFLGNQDFAQNFDVANIKLGQNAWYGPSGYLDGIITKFVIYDRVLTNDELTTVSKSFL